MFSQEPGEKLLDEATTIKFSVRFLLICSGALVSLIIMFYSMKNDISNSLSRIEQQGHILEDQGKAIRQMQDSIMSVQFHQEQERRDIDSLQIRKKYDQ